MRIAICGGTFDPFHRGHLEPVLAVREQMKWDRIVYMPAWIQPFKQGRESVSPYHRFAMAVLATGEHDSLYVSPWELERATVSYSVETLRHLRSEFPDATLEWIIGGDNLHALVHWKEIESIFDLANFVVIAREGQMDAPSDYAERVVAAERRPPSGAIVFAANREVPVSSTQIRLRAAAGETIDHLVDPRVSRYIHHNGLYRKGNS